MARSLCCLRPRHSAAAPKCVWTGLIRNPKSNRHFHSFSRSVRFLTCLAMLHGHAGTSTHFHLLTTRFPEVLSSMSRKAFSIPTSAKASPEGHAGPAADSSQWCWHCRAWCGTGSGQSPARGQPDTAGPTPWDGGRLLLGPAGSSHLPLAQAAQLQDRDRPSPGEQGAGGKHQPGCPGKPGDGTGNGL